MNPQADEGFTLVELLVAVIIGALLVGAVTSALMMSLKVTSDASTRIDGTRDTELSSLYFATDVQSAATVVVPPATPACWVAPPAGVTAQFVVAFSASDGTQTTYSLWSYSGSTQRELQRRKCPPATPASSVTAQVLARDVKTASPAVLCPLDTACSATARRIDLALTSGTVNYVLTGTRRAS